MPAVRLFFWNGKQITLIYTNKKNPCPISVKGNLYSFESTFAIAKLFFLHVTSYFQPTVKNEKNNCKVFLRITPTPHKQHCRLRQNFLALLLESTGSFWSGVTLTRRVLPGLTLRTAWSIPGNTGSLWACIEGDLAVCCIFSSSSESSCCIVFFSSN